MIRARLICLFAFMAAAIPAIADAYTLENVLSAPYASDLVASRDGKRIAWVGYERGVRNVWTAAAPAFNPRRLTGYTEDDGQPLGGIALGPDSRWLVYVRGGAPNGKGEHPNPTSNPRPPEQAVWAVDLQSPDAEPVKLGKGHGPAISPAGGRVAFLDKGKVFMVALGGEDIEPPEEPWIRARGDLGGLRWSPDGSRLAFVSDRNDHAFIGVYHVEDEAIRWMAPGVDRDSHPAWSPNGERVAFVRLPGRKRGETLHLMRNQPFELWIADAGTGEGRLVWQSPGEDGFFAHFYVDEPLRWPAGNTLVVYSEHEDWLRIYRLDIEEGEPHALTPPGCFTEQSDVEAGTLVFSGNCKDVDRRHLWRGKVDGGGPALLTRGEGIETDPVVLDDEMIAYRGATWRTPQAIMVAGADGREARRVWPADLPEAFPADEFVEPRQVTFQSSDGLKIHGQLFEPPGGGDGQRPALVFMHGGPVRQMLRGWHYSHYYANAYAMNQYMAQRGYVVLAVNYRAGIGYGRDFRLAENQGPRGSSEYRDIRAAGLFLSDLPSVDGDRIGLWGGSYGGLLTALGLAEDSDLFAAGVDLHGVHDWAFRATDLLEGGAWGIDGEEALNQARESSPVARLEYWSSPVLFIHGDDDRNVLFAQTTDLVQRLRERDVHTEVLVFPDEVHGFLRHESWYRAFEATADFFDRFLGERR